MSTGPEVFQLGLGRSATVVGTFGGAWSPYGYTELLSHLTLLADTKIGFSSSYCDRGHQKNVGRGIFLQITNDSFNIFRLINSGEDFSLKQQLLYNIL